MSPKRGITPASFPFLDYSRYTFSMGVEKGGFLWLSGQTAAAYDPTSHQIRCQGDVLEQTRVVYEKLRLTLEAAGASFADVVKTVDYITPAARPRYRDTAAVRRAYFGGNFPAATGVVVDRLLRPDALIEVEAIAQLAGRPKRAVSPNITGEGRYTYTPAVEQGELLWISGHTAQESDPATGAPVYRGGIVEQTHTIYSNLERILEAAGATFADVVKTVDYVTPSGLTDYAAAQAVRRQYFGNDPPVFTTLIVTQLLHAAAQIEIDMVAVKGGAKKIVAHPSCPSGEGNSMWAGIQKGPLLFIASQSGVNACPAAPLPVGDLIEQTRQAYANVRTIVEAAGGCMDDVLKTVEFVTPMGLHDYRRTAEIRRQYFREPYPAATGIVVPYVLQPGRLIQVDAVAVVG